jgi:hypothetical protein
MDLYNDIYNRNKKLDDIFMNKYFNIYILPIVSTFVNEMQ